MYGDVVLRFVQNIDYTGPFLPGYVKEEGMPLNYGTPSLNEKKACS